MGAEEPLAIRACGYRRKFRMRQLVLNNEVWPDLASGVSNGRIRAVASTRR